MPWQIPKVPMNDVLREISTQTCERIMCVFGKFRVIIEAYNKLQMTEKEKNA